MSMTKLFKLLCIIPFLAGCEQTTRKETLVIFGCSEFGEEMPSEYAEKLKELNPFYSYSSQRYDVTPKELNGVCKLYAYDLSIIDVLVYQGEVYSIRMDNTHGFTRLAYYKGEYKEALYYSRDIGSGRHILQIGAFNLREKQDMAVDIGLNDRGQMYDYVGVVFEKSKPGIIGYDEKKMLGARELKYNKGENPDDSPYVVGDGYLYTDLTTYQLVSWDKFKAQQ